METHAASKAEQTRQRIFDAAIPLFIERGHEETTMRAIALAADSSLGLAVISSASTKPRSNNVDWRSIMKIVISALAYMSEGNIRGY